jgi:hypothetical protein
MADKTPSEIIKEKLEGIESTVMARLKEIEKKREQAQKNRHEKTF